MVLGDSSTSAVVAWGGGCLEGEECTNVRGDALPERGAPPKVGARQVVLDFGANSFLLLSQLLTPMQVGSIQATME